MCFHRQVAKGKQYDVARGHGHGPCTVAVVWIHAREARTGDHSMVSSLKISSAH